MWRRIWGKDTSRIEESSFNIKGASVWEPTLCKSNSPQKDALSSEVFWCSVWKCHLAVSICCSPSIQLVALAAVAAVALDVTSVSRPATAVTPRPLLVSLTCDPSDWMSSIFTIPHWLHLKLLLFDFGILYDDILGSWCKEKFKSEAWKLETVQNFKVTTRMWRE